MSNSANQFDNYESFIGKRDILISLIEQQVSLLTTLGMKTWVETLQNLKNRVSADSFKILIIGEFKRGKSTFINALLGQEILPARYEPCTAIINEIKWSESSKAVLHHLAKSSNSQKKIEEISLTRLEEYVTINDENAIKLHEKYEKVEIFWPLELCRNGVELIDSPGLNENRVRSNLTQSYLPIVDATLFILSCDVLASQSELRTIENMRTIGHQDIFFVANKFDNIKKEQNRFKQYAISKLAPLTQLGKDGVFFISAINALDGRLDNDEQKVIDSGIISLEKGLEKFLATDRGRIKIIEPAKVLQESIKAAQTAIPARKAMLNTNRDELERRYRDAQEPLKLLKVKQEQIERRISQFCEDLGNLVETRAYEFYGYLADNVNVWIDRYELENPEQNFFNILKKTKQIEDELSQYLTNKIEDEFVRWQKLTLKPFLDSRIETLKVDLDARASNFIQEVEKLRSQLASDGSPAPIVREAIERLLLASGIAIKTYTYNLTFSPRWLIILTFPNEAKIREKISTSFTEQILRLRNNSSKQLAKDIVSNLQKAQDAINRGLENEIKSFKEQVSTVLAEKEKGKTNVAKKLDELKEVSETLDKLDGEIDDLIIQLVQI